MSAQWQYTDSTHKVVFRVNKDGSLESHLVSVAIIQQWLAEGNKIAEEDTLQ